MKNSKDALQGHQQWHICSDVVTVRWPRSGKQERMETAVLEEIGPDGAVVQLENEVSCHTTVRLDCSTAGFDGVIRECRYEKGLGYFVKIFFAADQQWSTDVYQPRHLMDPDDDTSQPSVCLPACGAQERCPTEYVARAVDPRSVVGEIVHRVAQNIAVVCGEMDLMDLAKCFVHHFGAPAECRLFTAFVSAYRGARENMVGPYEQPVSPLRQACNIAMLLASVPDEALRSPAPQESQQIDYSWSDTAVLSSEHRIGFDSARQPVKYR